VGAVLFVGFLYRKCLLIHQRHHLTMLQLATKEPPSIKNHKRQNSLSFGA
jgi:hypothetical protein